MFVTDTHSLVWHLTDDERLGSKAKDIFKKADEGESKVIIPTIVLAEALFISRRGRVSFDDLIAKIEMGVYYEIYPLNMRVISEMKKLTIEYSIHDSVIVATAKILDSDVITEDEVIQKKNDVKAIWA